MRCLRPAATPLLFSAAFAAQMACSTDGSEASSEAGTGMTTTSTMGDESDATGSGSSAAPGTGSTGAETGGEDAEPIEDPPEGPCSIWVAADGDNEADGSEQAPFASIDKAATAVTAGDTVCIGAGIYSESGEFTQHSSWGISTAIRVQADGTPEARITFRAAPGDEGKVVVDLARENRGFLVSGDYVTIKNLEIRNCYRTCVRTPAFELTETDESQATLGFALIHNYIHYANANDAPGNNVSNIALVDISTAKNALIRNNWLHTALINDDRENNHRATLMCYACWGGTIEYNDFSDSSGAMLFKTQIPGAEGPTISFNNVHDIDGGLIISTAGRAFTAERYRVFSNLFATTRSAISGNMSEAMGFGLEIRNNIFMAPIKRAMTIYTRGFEDIEISHNIFVDPELMILIGTWFSNGAPTYASMDEQGVLPGPMQGGGETVGLLRNTWVFDKHAEAM